MLCTECLNDDIPEDDYVRMIPGPEIIMTIANQKGKGGYAALILATVNWALAPLAILVDFGAAEVLYLRLGDTVTGLTRNKATGRQGWATHSLVVEGEGAGFAFPPTATNFLAQDAPGSREEQVGSESYHGVIRRAITSLVAAAASTQTIEEAVVLLNQWHAGMFLSFSQGPFTAHMEKCAVAGEVPAFLVDFCVANGIAVEVDVAAVLEARLPRGAFQVVSGPWGPSCEGYAKSVALPLGLRDLAAQSGVQIRRRARQQQSA